MNALKLHGRVYQVYQVKGSNLNFLRALPNEWKTTTVSVLYSYEYKDYTLDRLYGVLKTHELEMKQDEDTKKRQREDKSVVLVASNVCNKQVESKMESSTKSVSDSRSKPNKVKDKDVEEDDDSST